MTSNAEKILEEELGKIAELAVSEKSVKKGAREGAIIAAKLLPTENKKHGFIVSNNIKDAGNKIKEILKSDGTLLSSTAKKGKGIIKGVIKAGFSNMNPCHLTMVLTSVSSKQTRISIEASAKEGLIKQNTAIEAIKRIKELFQK